MRHTLSSYIYHDLSKPPAAVSHEDVSVSITTCETYKLIWHWWDLVRRQFNLSRFKTQCGLNSVFGFCSLCWLLSFVMESNSHMADEYTRRSGKYLTSVALFASSSTDGENLSNVVLKFSQNFLLNQFLSDS